MIKEIKYLEDLINKNTDRILTKESSFKVSHTQMKVLEYLLSHQGEKIYQKDIENFTHLSRATVSGVLQTMEKHHLIEREIDSIDTRTKIIILAKDTQKFFDTNKRKFDYIEKQLVDHISQEDLVIFNKVLKQMTNNMKEIGDQ